MSASTSAVDERANVLADLGGDPDERTDGLAGYAVKLPVFEGPLDLLLHLIRQNEVDITDIPIARIAEQYLETIELMQELNLDVAAEYLVMAATLALIKSRMLLPSEGQDDEDESDPRADLVQRLLEYQRFKEAAETLSRRRLLGRDVWSVVGPGPERTPESEREIEVGLFELVDAFRAVLENASAVELKHEVETEAVTVRTRMLVVMDLLESHESIEFTRIFEVDGESGPPSRAVLVATFLAILELARLTALRIYQGISDRGTPEGPIRCRRATVDAETPEWRERITDTM
ncbi:MAG: segregation/condensation protein A [Spirochaetaceae bacterium]|nr:segregation/condensation protein A [Myxococcales bacterium]MCB9722985.1 segregation/condensation protein A [Spirochaetaceae bacterium]HPG24530.1 segregation/condensation protein A [Myxococcota bacterium]